MATDDAQANDDDGGRGRGRGRARAQLKTPLMKMTCRWHVAARETCVFYFLFCRRLLASGRHSSIRCARGRFESFGRLHVAQTSIVAQLSHARALQEAAATRELVEAAAGAGCERAGGRAGKRSVQFSQQRRQRRRQRRQRRRSRALSLRAFERDGEHGRRRHRRRRRRPTVERALLAIHVGERPCACGK